MRPLPVVRFWDLAGFPKPSYDDPVGQQRQQRTGSGKARPSKTPKTRCRSLHLRRRSDAAADDHRVSHQRVRFGHLVQPVLSLRLHISQRTSASDASNGSQWLTRQQQTDHLPCRSVSVDPLDSGSLVQNFHPQLGRGRARLRRWAVLEGIGGQRAHPAVQDSPRHSSVNEGRAGREGPSTRSARETAGCPAQAVRRRWPIAATARSSAAASSAAGLRGSCARGRRHRR